MLTASRVFLVSAIVAAAGGMARTESDVRIWEPVENSDELPPAIRAEVAGTLSDSGWYISNVVVKWIVTTSNPETNPVTSSSGCGGQTIAIDTPGVTITCTATTGAGASAQSSSASVTIRRDATPPIIRLTRRLPQPNGYGWNNTPVMVSWSCSDALSGATSNGVAHTIRSEGAAQMASGTCVDYAGNSSTAGIGGINIDWTPPVVSCAPTPASLWPPDHTLVPVAIALGIDGGLSGRGEHILQTVTSNEPDEGLGDGDSAGDIAGFVPGTMALSGSLRAERAGTGTGRVYALGYRGFDRAGNGSRCTATITVPKDRGKGSSN